MVATWVLGLGSSVSNVGIATLRGGAELRVSNAQPFLSLIILITITEVGLIIVDQSQNSGSRTFDVLSRCLTPAPRTHKVLFFAVCLAHHDEAALKTHHSAVVVTSREDEGGVSFQTYHAVFRGVFYDVVRMALAYHLPIHNHMPTRCYFTNGWSTNRSSIWHMPVLIFEAEHRTRHCARV